MNKQFFLFKWIFCALYWIACTPELLAQQDYWRLELNFGGERSLLKNLGTTLVNDPAYTGYSFDQKYKNSNMSISIGAQYRMEMNKGKSRDWEWLLLGWSPNLTLSLSNAQFWSKDNDKMNYQDLKYEDVRNLQYKVHYNFNYLIINPLSGRFGYITGDTDSKDWCLFGEVGLPYYVNISPSDLTFWSNQNNPTSDLEIQKEMQKYISGQNYFAIQYGLGGYLNFADKVAFSLRLMRMTGLRDALGALSNPHGFINNANHRSSYNVSIGLSFCVFGKS